MTSVAMSQVQLKLGIENRLAHLISRFHLPNAFSKALDEFFCDPHNHFVAITGSADSAKVQSVQILPNDTLPLSISLNGERRQ